MVLFAQCRIERERRGMTVTERKKLSTSSATIVVTGINSQFVEPRLEGCSFHPEFGSRTMWACQLAVNFSENVDDVVAFDSFQRTIDLNACVAREGCQ